MRAATVSAPRTARRAGFTLLELMIALVLLGMIGGTIASLIVRQQRYFRGAQDSLDSRAELRRVGALLPTD
jgi:prepilin-type N-terminal cleavage/methylation domain-containing protein